ncbi:hypothetical protein O181_013403 [Austropuccinia psidii MF-1]|uniref:Tf2-1-like SH3-like domain-containing protein n=1 Tax=Austropuccinia psidii MF-1 TaxID=1389203 RepID=A0A9Q3BYM2_9BASI|nr:hypothetical protein [Austropuccinia psidii MF-1]
MSVTIKITGTSGSLCLNLPIIIQNINQQSNHPFFTIYGRNPSPDSNHIFDDTPSGKLSKNLQSVHQLVKEELQSAIRQFEKYADRNRSIPPDLQCGDKVWLASKNIKTTRPTKILSERLLGPFEVLNKIGSHGYHVKFP